MHDNSDVLQRLQAHYDAMPPVAALGLHVAGYDGARLSLGAPLARHVNDKGCAFGGSLGSLLTLAEWGLLHVRLEQAGIDADLYVADSQLRFVAPLFDDLQAEAMLAPGAEWPAFVAALRNRGRARIEVEARVPLPAGGVATTFTGRYVAILRRGD